MSAAVTQKPGNKWQAFCEEHQDGVNVRSVGSAYVWADLHNEKEHDQ